MKWIKSYKLFEAAEIKLELLNEVFKEFNSVFNHLGIWIELAAATPSAMCNMKVNFNFAWNYAAPNIDGHTDRPNIFQPILRHLNAISAYPCNVGGKFVKDINIELYELARNETKNVRELNDNHMEITFKNHVREDIVDKQILWKLLKENLVRFVNQFWEIGETLLMRNAGTAPNGRPAKSHQAVIKSEELSKTNLSIIHYVFEWCLDNMTTWSQMEDKVCRMVYDRLAKSPDAYQYFSLYKNTPYYEKFKQFNPAAFDVASDLGDMGF